MDIYGLVGKNISHSKSPLFFNSRFKKLGIDAEYRLFDMDTVKEVEDLIKNTPNLKGLNVTIPYKRALSFLTNECSSDVKYSGSLNVLKITETNNNKIISSYNTDVMAFEETIKKHIKNNRGIKALIFGTGGVAHSVAYVLRKLGVFYYYVSRNPLKVAHFGYNWINKDICDSFKLFVNCSPAGMYPHEDELIDIPYNYLGDSHICYDCVYNPEETQFLAKAKENGATIIGGMPMFKMQAELSWNIWMK
ncbi:MAG: shikimate dehydrogenase [Marinilabiliales bacterium]|nr:MAG: shikimate dehydrogenase [Marinilabiliales bacterium]